MRSDLQVAVVGAGIGGVAAAVALQQRGADVIIYEQAEAFGRVGAGINLTPNSVNVLDGLEIGERLRCAACTPKRRVNRAWKTGEVLSTLDLGEHAIEQYGAPLLSLHRADLLDLMESMLQRDSVRFGSKLVSLKQVGESSEIHFADGSRAWADIVIAADGIHSAVRDVLFPGEEAAFYTGMSAYRSIYAPPQKLGRYMDDLTKWWGPTRESEIVTFPVNHRKDLFVFATVPDEHDSSESWSARAEADELMLAFQSFASDAREVISNCKQPLRTALHDRRPLGRWTGPSVALLGDSCHAMTPFMAQGAAMALEDAAVLTRCLLDEYSGSVTQSLSRYEHARRDRASEIQLNSHNNEWQGTGLDAEWVYSYDAWKIELP